MENFENPGTLALHVITSCPLPPGVCCLPELLQPLPSISRILRSAVCFAHPLSSDNLFADLQELLCACHEVLCSLSPFVILHPVSLGRVSDGLWTPSPSGICRICNDAPERSGLAIPKVGCHASPLVASCKVKTYLFILPNQLHNSFSKLDVPLILHASFGREVNDHHRVSIFIHSRRFSPFLLDAGASNFPNLSNNRNLLKREMALMVRIILIEHELTEHSSARDFQASFQVFRGPRSLRQINLLLILLSLSFALIQVLALTAMALSRRRSRLAKSDLLRRSQSSTSSASSSSSSSSSSSPSPMYSSSLSI